MTDNELLTHADSGIRSYLDAQRESGGITGTYYDAAIAQTGPNLRKWLSAEVLDRISPGLRDGLREAIRREHWVALTNAFSRDVAFGTGGIREKMGANRDEVLRLKSEGIHAPIIKGPNTINDVVYLLTSAGVARFGLKRSPRLERVVIGFDSRVRGADFARIIAETFLAYEYTVYLFDEACLYPSVTFAVPVLRADIGVFISASHNDFRYNGFKLSCQNGSQFDPQERATLYDDYIRTTTFDDIKLMPIAEAPKDRLWFLGGVKSSTNRVLESGPHTGLPLADPLPEYGAGYGPWTDRIIDLHTMHADHVKTFLSRPELMRAAKHPLHIGYSAFNGSGRKAVPRLLEEVGFQDVRRIMALDAFEPVTDAMLLEPDPGDWRAADIAVNAFRREYPDKWDATDLIIGTDPDADRCGVIVRTPPDQRAAYPHPGMGDQRDYTLLSADEVWTLMLWYRLMAEVERDGAVTASDTKFIVLSHTTTDMLVRVARMFGLGVLKTWVGFAQLAAATCAMWDLAGNRDTPGLTEGGTLPSYDEGRRLPDETMCNRTIHSWEAMDSGRRQFNVAALEQSNGFSLLGGPPPDARSLGVGGHVRDKDGTFAAILVAELAAWAKEQGTNLIDLLDEKIYLDPAIGLFATHYEPDPIDGEYEGLAGYTKKRNILDEAERLLGRAVSERVTLGDIPVVSTIAYRTGKYDRANWEGFPDEGLRFYFDEERLSHLTIRPSGTSNALRFHVQLFGGHPKRAALLETKTALRKATVRVVDDVRRLIDAPR